MKKIGANIFLLLSTLVLCAGCGSVGMVGVQVSIGPHAGGFYHIPPRTGSYTHRGSRYPYGERYRIPDYWYPEYRHPAYQTEVYIREYYFVPPTEVPRYHFPKTDMPRVYHIPALRFPPFH